MTGIPIVDCATGTCVPCSCRRHSRRTFSSRRRCTSTRADRRARSLDQNLSHAAIITFYCQIPRSRSKDHLTICGHRCPSGTMRKAVRSARLFGGLSVRLSQWSIYPPAFISVSSRIFPKAHKRSSPSRSHSQATLSDTFDCVTPASQSNLGLKPCGSGTCKPNSPGCLANKQLILKSIAVKSQ